LLQGWLFLEDFWTYERAQAYLTAVPLGGMLVLDLYSDGAPQWSKYDSYFGHSWIFNSLVVFGGRRGIYGALPSYTSSPYADRSASPSLVGIGVTPEAIDMSQPMFDAMLESGWRASPPEPRAWLQSYAVRRYGGEAPSMRAATDTLYDAAYNNRDIDESIIEDSPGSQSGSRNTNATGLLTALRLYQVAFSQEGLVATSGPASYDLTDLTRQVLCNIFQDAHDCALERGVGRARARAPLCYLALAAPSARAPLTLFFPRCPFPPPPHPFCPCSVCVAPDGPPRPWRRHAARAHCPGGGVARAHCRH
jgi:alpha-N-acetylglucosaminidase